MWNTRQASAGRNGVRVLSDRPAILLEEVSQSGDTDSGTGTTEELSTVFNQL